MAYYPIFGRYIIDYPKPANPRHLTGSVSEMMDADSFPLSNKILLGI